MRKGGWVMIEDLKAVISTVCSSHKRGSRGKTKYPSPINLQGAPKYKKVSMLFCGPFQNTV